MSARQPWADPTLLQVRPADPNDRDRVARFLAAMDRDGLYERHFAHGEAPNLALLRRIEVLDQRDRVAVLAVGPDGEVLGHGEYVAERGAAEFALMVRPLVRRQGIGSRLLHALQEVAVVAGQREMHGIIQASNTRALNMVRNSGFRLAPGEDRTVVIASRHLPPVPDAAQAGPASVADHLLPQLIRHDFDRTPLHRCFSSRVSLRARGGQMQRVAADAFGGGEKT